MMMIMLIMMMKMMSCGGEKGEEAELARNSFVMTILIMTTMKIKRMVTSERGK